MEIVINTVCGAWSPPLSTKGEDELRNQHLDRVGTVGRRRLDTLGLRMKLPLWLDGDRLDGPSPFVWLARCRNCGEVKVNTYPCGFDHLAAVLEFRAFLDHWRIGVPADGG